MNSSGLPDTDAPQADPAGGGIPVWLGLLALAGALVLALVIGVQIISALYAMIAPPVPPLPADVVEMEHLSTAHGIDEWLYGSQDDPCAITAFYAEQGATCTPREINLCDGARLTIEADSVPITTPISTCTGGGTFSVFDYAYRVNVWAGYGEVSPTRFRVTREVFWGGTPPDREAQLDVR